MVNKRLLAVLAVALLVPLGFATLLALPHDATTKEGFVPDTYLTGHVAGHAYWAALFAGLAAYLFATRRPRRFTQAWRQDTGACIAFAGLCLLAVAQLGETAAAVTMGHSADDRWHDAAIIYGGMPAQAILVLGLVVWGIQVLVRRRQGAPAPVA